MNVIPQFSWKRALCKKKSQQWITLILSEYRYSPTITFPAFCIFRRGARTNGFLIWVSDCAWLTWWYRVFSLTWSASMQIYWNKRKRLHKKRVQLPQDWFGTPRWPPWRHVKTLYNACPSNPRLFDNEHTPHWRQQWYVSRTVGRGPDPPDSPGNWNIHFLLVSGS